MKNKTPNITSDFIWYLFGTALPMVLLFFRSVIYTRIFTPEQYGTYSLIFITFTYLTSISYQGATNNAWRYYYKYKNNNNLSHYKGTLVWFYIGFSLISLIGCSIWYLLVVDVFIKKLIVLGFIYSITNELYNTLFVPARLEGKANIYNQNNIYRAIISFSILLLLTFIFDYCIDAFFIGPIIANILFIAPLLLRKTNTKLVLFSASIIKHIKRFVNYGAINLLYNLGLFLLISSDRYIIALFNNYDKVGIYNQTYNIGQITVAALIAVLNSTINPILIQELEKKPKTSDHILKKYFSHILFLTLPLTIALSLFSKEIVTILLGKEFREAWYILPYIFTSALLFGLNYFFVLKIKFNNKFSTLMLASTTAATINIIANIIFIPIYGYKVAALTTLLAYLYLFIVLLLKSKIQIFKKEDIVLYIRLFLTSTLIIIIDFIINNNILLDNIILQCLLRLVSITVVYTSLNYNYSKKIILSLYAGISNKLKL